jgi:hypothetical protein
MYLEKNLGNGATVEQSSEELSLPKIDITAGDWDLVEDKMKSNSPNTDTSEKSSLITAMLVLNPERAEKFIKENIQIINELKQAVITKIEKGEFNLRELLALKMLLGENINKQLEEKIKSNLSKILIEPSKKGSYSFAAIGKDILTLKAFFPGLNEILGLTLEKMTEDLEKYKAKGQGNALGVLQRAVAIKLLFPETGLKEMGLNEENIDRIKNSVPQNQGQREKTLLSLLQSAIAIKYLSE